MPRLVLAVTLLLLLSDAARAQDREVPDFTGAIHGRKLGKVTGSRKVLAVLWDPQRKGHPAPPAREIDGLLFGPRPSMADWFRETSNGKLKIVRVGTVGWLRAEHPAAHYWGRRKKPIKGWVGGHVEKWAEAIRKAAAKIPLKSHDENKDGVLTADELAIVVVIPQRRAFGTVRRPAGQEHPRWRPLVVDGVRIPAVAEYYTGLPANLGAVTHELCHLLLKAPDLYQSRHWAYRPGKYSLMDFAYSTTHLDPFHKLKLGWSEPTIVTRTSEHTLEAVERGGRLLVVYDRLRGPGEYLLLENRWIRGTYDAGVPKRGSGLANSGLAVWHIIEDPRGLARVRPPTGGAREWGRRGIRLIRRNGGRPLDDRQALFTRKGDMVGGDTTPARLRWSDGKDAGIKITLLSPPGPKVRLLITVRRWY